MSKPIDAIEYKQIKHKLKWRQSVPKLLAKELGRSEATILRVKGSSTFDEFQALSKAEHPPESQLTVGKQVNRLLSVLGTKEAITDADKRFIKTGKRPEVV